MNIHTHKQNRRETRIQEHAPAHTRTNVPVKERKKKGRKERKSVGTRTNVGRNICQESVYLVLLAGYLKMYVLEI